jgi:hypothetical protein
MEGESMVVVPLQKPEYELKGSRDAAQTEEANWVGIAAGGALIAGGLLLLAGQRRAGTVAAASGTALALLDQQETLHRWWTSLPGYIGEIEQLMANVQGAVDDLAARRAKLLQILAKAQ